MKLITSTLSSLIYWTIRFYQKFLNPLIKAIGGPNTGCRYSPTCSNYFLQAVKLHGPYRGSWLGTCRIFRCHPWGGCGHDPVPSKKTSSQTSSHHHDHTSDDPSV